MCVALKRVSRTNLSHSVSAGFSFSVSQGCRATLFRTWSGGTPPFSREERSVAGKFALAQWRATRECRCYTATFVLHCTTIIVWLSSGCLTPERIGRCPSTVPPVFPVLVFQLSKQQNRTGTTFSTVLGTPPNRTRTKRFPLEELWGSCFVSWVLNWESTENWDFHSWEPYKEPYSDTS